VHHFGVKLCALNSEFHAHERKKFMRTHIELDGDVLDQVMDLGKFASKKAAVNAALAELSRALKRRQLLALRGKVAWQGDLDMLRSPRAGTQPV
jgi:Arc/MetJ family transcription regulator